jgi:serine/threonine-protein kinase
MRPSYVSAYPAAGEIIDGKYQIVQMLGEGGMGAVAKAHHMLRRAPVALKFMAPHVLTVPGAVERFLNEAVAASQIENQHVVTIYDVGKLPGGAPYLVMEFLDGRDLAHLIDSEGQRGIDVPRAVHFVLQILRALQVAHAAGIVHRDLKPSNAFIIRKDGERDFVKLVDFGISKVSQPGAASLTQTNSALGTPLYMSPEQAKSPRDVDLRSDLYSVGCLFYELLTGRTPHFSESGELTEILFKLFTQDPTPIKEHRPDLPMGLPEVVHTGLARDRDRRYASALEFAEALAPFADERSAQVLARLRAPLERRSEPPPVHGSMPVPMASLQAFSQLNSMQFPQPAITPSGVPGAATPSTPAAPYASDVRPTPSGAPARTQALPGASAPPTRSDQVAVAGTQSSHTAMGVVSDARDPRVGKTPAVVFLAPVLCLGAIAGGGYYWYASSKAPPATASPDPAGSGEASAHVAPAEAPPSASFGPRVVAPPPTTPPVASSPPSPVDSPSATASAKTPAKLPHASHTSDTSTSGTKLPGMGVTKKPDL